MTRKILVASESDIGFHKKLIQKAVRSIQFAGHEVVGSAIRKENWREIFDKAILYDADDIYITRLIRPEDFYRELSLYRKPTPPISFLLGGISEQLRRPEAKVALQKLANSWKINKIFIISIHWKSLMQYLEEIKYLQSKKVIYMDQPLYEKTYSWRKLTKGVARMALNLPKKAKIALYFGAYWYSRGPDILLEVAMKTPDVHFCFVGDTKLQSIEITPGAFKKYKNIRFKDEYVSDGEMRHWFRAADLIVLPYRRYYEHDSSGVFDQAMMAERPVVVPNFSPFIDIYKRYNIGYVFGENELADTIQHAFWHLSRGYTYDFKGYLKQKGTWRTIGEKL